VASSAHGQQEPPPIIDMHLHGGFTFGSFPVGPDGKLPKRPCLPTGFCDPGPAELSSVEEVIPATLAAMNKHNIVLGVVSDILPVPKDHNWVFDDWNEADPGRFIFGYGMRHPTDISLANLRGLLESGEVSVIGELAFQYSEIVIDDPILEPIFALADELDVPVHIHLAGMGGGQTFPVHLGDPLRLSTVLQKHPTLRVYIENASFPFLEGISAVLLKYPNVYVDVSTATWILPREAIHTHIKGLVDRGLSKKIMFGSDQMLWPETIELAIETIEAADFLTPEQKRDIFYNNAARFLRLTEDEIAAHHGN
jgi:predicted TIM-barrel fold metal-dependent hydrolase